MLRLLKTSPALILSWACASNEPASSRDTASLPGDEGPEESDTNPSADTHTGDSEDSSPRDTSTPDSGHADSGSSDSGQDDTGVHDTGIPDSGTFPTEQVADFSLLDINETSTRYGQPVSPRDYLEQVSGWYFAHAT